MATIQLPYGSESISLEVPDNHLKGVFEPEAIAACADTLSEVKQALRNPLDTARLSSLVQKGVKVLILVDDHTRTTPADLILPPLLDELNASGIDGGDITILVTHGTHRLCSEEELIAKLGKRVYGNYRIEQHDCQQESQQAFVGLTGRGTPVWVNKLMLEADFRIGIGHVGPSPFAGYSGGGKLILPGVSSLDTINANHALVPLGFRKFGQTDIPCRADIDEAARLIPLDFLINVVPCQDGSVAKVFAGSMERVFQEGLALARQVFEIRHEGLADIAITSAYPYDIDLYQAVRAIEFGDVAVKAGGAILMAAACPQGVGLDEFYQLLSAPDGEAEDYLRKIVRRKGKVTFNVLGYALARIRAEKQVLLLTDGIQPQAVREMGFLPAQSLQETLDSLLEQYGPSATVSVFPAGSATIPVVD